MSVLSRTITIVAIVAVIGSLARADSKDEQARVLFERARALVKSGDFERACPLFEESEALVPALGTELNLAQCWTEIGKLLAAKTLYEQVLERATQANQKARIDLANDGLTLLARRIPRLEISVTGGPAQVTVDGKPVDIATPIAVDPGSHVIVAIGADDRRAEATVVTKADGAITKVPLETSAPKRIEPEPPPPPPSNRLRTRIGWSMIATGGAGLVTGAVFGVLAHRKKQSAIDECVVEGDTATCPVPAAQRLRTGTKYGNISTLSIVAGIVLGGAGVALLVTRPSERGTRVHAHATPQGGQLVIEGTW